jgi:hypothetical protein
MVIPLTGNIKRFAALCFLCLVVAGVTAKAEANPTQSVVTSRNGWLELDDKRFFPIMWQASTLCPDRQTVDSLVVGLGVNFIEHQDLGCNSSDMSTLVADLHAALDGRAWWYERTPHWRQRLQGLPELVDWQADAQFFYDAESLQNCIAKSTASTYTEAKAELSAGAVIFTIALQDYLTPSYANCLDSRRLTALFYTGIVAGARAIEYSTDYRWNSQKPFVVTSELQQQAKKLAAQLKTLTPVLMAPVASIRLRGSSAVKVVARRFNGGTYVIAVNTSGSAQRATITVGRASSRRAEVMWERRRLSVVRKTFTDRFAPLRVHVYKIR